MIIVTPKGSPSPLIGRVKGTLVASDVSVPSVCAAVQSAVRQFPGETDGFLFIASGGHVHSARVWEALRRTSWDVAAYVDRIGSPPKAPGAFNGIGRVCLDVLLFRPTEAGKRVLARWADRNAVRAGNEAVELAIALTETGVGFLQLGRSWIWRETDMRSLEPNAQPVVEFREGKAAPVAAPKKVKEPLCYKPRDPEVLYSAHLRDYSGYAKASRNVLFRISNSIRVKVDQSDIAKEQVIVDIDTNRRIDAYTRALISERAPLLRFYTPKQETRKSHRICFTMMETETLSPEFASTLNANYNEALVPTAWNKDVFLRGGVKIPISVVPLGVDQIIYAPGPKTKKQDALLLTTSRAGAVEKPNGYTFVMVFQPTFRKGVDHLVAAFDRAFSRHPDDASLVLVTSVHAKLEQYGCAPFSRLKRGDPRSTKAKVYHLTGSWSELEMARLYRAFDCYVAASGAEGWDLPLCEAAACGLPVIATKASSHPELLNGTSAEMYSPDGYAKVPGSENVSRFYSGQKFAMFDTAAVERLSELMKNAVGSMRRSATRCVVQIDHTWDRSAALVAKKIIEAGEL